MRTGAGQRGRIAGDARGRAAGGIGLLLCVALLGTSVARSDELPSVDAAPLSSSRQYGAAAVEAFDYDGLPGRLADRSLRGLWAEGLGLELHESLLASAERYALIVGEVPEEAYTYWRIARNYWRYGEALPLDDKAGRIAAFETAESWAARGLSVDPDCAPCMLWKFVSMGRQATTRGLLSAARDVREMDRLIKRGIRLKPDHTDLGGNATLGNLYYAGAVFYRVIPDWFWLRWFLGVRGDMDKSLDYARHAVSISEGRVDYRVELGAVLLCMGTQKAREGALAEGRHVLEEAQGLAEILSTDHLDKAHARLLLEAPEKACGYSRDGFIDMNAVFEESKAKH